MHLSEFEAELTDVVEQLKRRMQHASPARRKRILKQARGRVARIIKAANQKLDRSRLGAPPKWYGDFTLQWGPLDRSKLPQKFAKAVSEAEAQIESLAAGSPEW